MGTWRKLSESELIEFKDYSNRYSLGFTCRLMGIGYNTGKRLAHEHGIYFVKQRLDINHNRKGGNNKGRTKYYYQGKPITYWADLAGVKTKAIADRLKRGMDEHKAYTMPKQTPRDCGYLNIKNLFTNRANKNREKLKKEMYNQAY